MKLSNNAYDALKWIALVFLPACQVLWLGLGKVWGFPYLAEIGASIACVDAFLGTLLGVSNLQYKKPEEGVQDTVNMDTFEAMMEVSDGYQDDTAEE